MGKIGGGTEVKGGQEANEETNIKEKWLLSDIGGKYVGNSYRWSIKRLLKEKYDIERSKTMDKYEKMKRFHYNRRLQARLYAFMYVYPEIMTEENYFSATKKFVSNYKKMSTPGPVPKHWLGFSYICSEYYELDLNFDET